MIGTKIESIICTLLFKNEEIVDMIQKRNFALFWKAIDNFSTTFDFQRKTQKCFNMKVM